METNRVIPLRVELYGKGKWSDNAVSKLEAATQNYTNALIEESYRVGMSKFLAKGDKEPEIAAFMVEQAQYAERYFAKSEKRPFVNGFFQLSAFTSSTITGGLFDVKEFEKPAYVSLFLTVFGIAVFSHMSVFLFDKK